MTDKEQKQTDIDGWRRAIESVRASLRDYPNVGGDIEIMKEVDRIVTEKTYELQRQNERWREKHFNDTMAAKKSGFEDGRASSSRDAGSWHPGRCEVTWEA